ncbi:hypothetical protein IAD21_04456 [Abditibacteriota bacterium]|nr:hypothetical protein IAD21_04456 [Abditibacteriota bacterium]
MKTLVPGVPLLFAGLFCSVARAQAPATFPAFPGAEGFGALATGGRGGEVVHVANLNDSGKGSFREAVSRPGHTVVFDVGGVIKTKSKIAVASNVTIAGQSAPGEGITIYGEGVSFSGSKNIIVRYVRFRQGIAGSRGGKAINVTKASDLIFDHVSALWGRWDSLGFTEGVERVTLQNSIIGQAIDPQRFGALIDGVHKVTLARNLWINNQSRHPKLKGDIQYINNVIYNWGVSGTIGGHSAAVWHQDMIGNLWIKGPASSSDKALDTFASTDTVFQRNNVVDLQPDGQLKTRPIEKSDFHGETPPTFTDAPFQTPPIAVTVQSPETTFETVAQSAGVSLHRDAVETTLIAQLRSLGTEGKIIRSEAEMGGQPEVTPVSHPADFDTDADGISDAWERQHGLNPNDIKDGPQLAPSGYSHLEEYLNSLCA